MANVRRSIGLACAAAALSAACTSMQQLVSAPEVQLRQVQIKNLDVAEQSFLLSFDVTNPNAFPLPVRTISYAVALDGHPFATGDTESSFTVPARGDGQFAISVDLNLLRTAPELLFIVRDGFRRDVAYSLTGELGIDLPYAKPVTFGSEGHVRLQMPGY